MCAFFKTKKTFWEIWPKTAWKLQTQYFLEKPLREQGKISPFFLYCRDSPVPPPPPPRPPTSPQNQCLDIFFQLSPQEFLIFIWSISEGWKVELTLEHCPLHQSTLPKQFVSLVIDLSNFPIPSDSRG